MFNLFNGDADLPRDVEKALSSYRLLKRGRTTFILGGGQPLLLAPKNRQLAQFEKIVKSHYPALGHGQVKLAIERLQDALYDHKPRRVLNISDDEKEDQGITMRYTVNSFRE